MAAISLCSSLSAPNLPKPWHPRPPVSNQYFPLRVMFNGSHVFLTAQRALVRHSRRLCRRLGVLLFALIPSVSETPSLDSSKLLSAGLRPENRSSTKGFCSTCVDAPLMELHGDAVIVISAISVLPLTTAHLGTYVELSAF